MDVKSGRKISRRNFLKASAVTVASSAGAATLAGSASNAQPPENTAVKSAAKASSPSGRVAGYCGEGDWLGAAPVIPDSSISKTVDVDVLVLGGGHAGLLAAVGASDLKAKVAVVEKQAEKAFEGYWARVGEDIGHVNSKWLIERGYGPYNTGEITAEFVKRAAGRCNPDIIRIYVENSGAMFDRLVEIYEEYKDLRKADDSKVVFTYSEGGRGPGYLLGRLKRSEEGEMEEMAGRAAEAVETIVAEGVEMAMTKYNRRAPGSKRQRQPRWTRGHFPCEGGGRCLDGHHGGTAR